MNIRPMQPGDIPTLEKICLETAAPSLQKDARARENTLLLYSRYYTRAEQDACFVATDEQDVPVGYILCAPDYNRYCKGFLSQERKEIQKLGFLRGIRATFEPRLQKPFAQEYPAHLHIDILPAYQGQGLGPRLMSALLTHLRANGVRGVYLCVGAKNTRAISFYQKQGFQLLQQMGGACCMGCTLL